MLGPLTSVAAIGIVAASYAINPSPFNAAALVFTFAVLIFTCSAWIIQQLHK